MKTNLIKAFAVSGLIASFAACGQLSEKASSNDSRYEFGNIVDIAYTPDVAGYQRGYRGLFTDAGSWMGFTLPQTDKWINGVCGPFSIDNRIWFAQSVTEVNFIGESSSFTPDSTSYFPGEVYLSASSPAGKITQRVNFVSASTALLCIESDVNKGFRLTGKGWDKDVRLEIGEQTITAYHPNGEVVQLVFASGVTLQGLDANYEAKTSGDCNQAYVAISFYASAKELPSGTEKTLDMLTDPRVSIKQNAERWEGYLSKILRDDMKPEYDRIAAKSAVTLIANWRTHREGLLHDGIVPSHAASYFVGYWGWDSWRSSAALARFAPEVAKNNIRAIFDYQWEDGMLIDCMYTDPAENNARDSKPPLASWAVDEVFIYNNDTAFVREMYPQLLKFYKWWYEKRDHNKNGMCEFGSTDGTLVAAGWESGMDNAIRFDHTKMLKNGKDAWSMDQENVDLNTYLAVEARLLKKFAEIIGAEFDGPDYSDKVADYFFDEKMGYFFDRRLKDGSFIEEPACEGYTPFWAKIATKEQMKKALVLLTDTAKFSTYIPFPTAAADNPKCDPNGYWRGPIWLDQTHLAITGLRNYGYKDLADEYTRQVFDRCEGLTGDAPIHENYGTHTGELLEAPHFSWSSAHLLMLYEDYGK